MKQRFYICLAAITLLSCQALEAGEREDRFYSDLSIHFEDTLGVVDALVEMGIANEDLPVCMYIARSAQTSPTRIGEVRKRGESWLEIIRGRGIKIATLYFMISVNYESKTYQPIFAKFSAVPENQWNNLILTDNDIVNLSNLRFIYQRHDYSVFEVMAMRDIGKTFVTINQQIGDLKKEWLKEQKKKKRQSAAQADSLND